MTQPPEMIRDGAALLAAVGRAADARRLAVDTEFVRERTYLAELALIQIGHGESVELIDPLAGIELASLISLLTDPARTKVLHAARQDLEVLLPLSGAPLAPLIDTQLAAALLGHPAQIGYGDLAARELGVTLEKGHARTDWRRRPLSAEQLRYAADDVRWLLPLAERLEGKLEAQGRLEWLREDCSALANPALYAADPALAWQRLKGAESLPPREQLRIRALAAWRERRARDRNLPRGWLLSDEALRAIARRAPRDLEALGALEVLAPSAVTKLGPAILVELAAAERAPLDEVVQRADGRPAEAERARLARLTSALREVATGLAIAPEVLATQRELKRIAHGEAAGSVLSGWRAGLLLAPLAAAAG